MDPQQLSLLLLPELKDICLSYLEVGEQIELGLEGEYNNIINNDGLYHAGKGGHMNLALFFLNKGAWMVNRAINGAILCNKTTFVKEFINMGKEPNPLNFTHYLDISVETGNLELVLFFTDKGAKNSRALAKAVEKRDMIAIEIFVNKGVSNYNIALHKAIMIEDIDMFTLLSEKCPQISYHSIFDASSQVKRTEFLRICFERKGLFGSMLNSYKNLYKSIFDQIEEEDKIEIESKKEAKRQAKIERRKNRRLSKLD